MKKIWLDIIKGKNIELYVTIVGAVAAIIANLFGFNIAPLQPIILTILTILIVNDLVQRHHFKELLTEVRQARSELFIATLTHQQQKDINDKVEEAKDLLVMGTNLDRTLDSFYAVFESKLKKGHQIRVLLIDPYSPACQMTAQRRYDSMKFDSFQHQVISTLDRLSGLKEKTSGNITIRVTDFHISYGGFVIDARTPKGTIFFWYHSYKTRKSSAPKFILSPENKYWYDHFLEEVDALWNDASIWSPQRQPSSPQITTQPTTAQTTSKNETSQD